MSIHDDITAERHASPRDAADDDARDGGLRRDRPSRGARPMSPPKKSPVTPLDPPIPVRVIAPGGAEMGGGRVLSIEMRNDGGGSKCCLRVGFPSPPGAFFTPSGDGLGKCGGFRIHPDDLLKVPGIAHRDTHNIRRRAVFDLLETSIAVGAAPRYRFHLRQEWGPIATAADDPTLLFVMMNPSVGDATDDDPTLVRCRNFAIREGFCAFEVVNLFAWIETNASLLKRAKDPIGPDNDAHIVAAARRAKKTLVAWGTPAGINLGPRSKVPAFRGRDEHVLRLLRETGVSPSCFGTTDGGAPCHPLMLANETAIVPFQPAPRIQP